MTYQEIRTVWASIEFAIALYGAEAKFLAEYQDRLRKIGQLICQQKGLPPEKIIGTISDDEVFSGEVVKAVLALKKWVDSQSHQ